MVKTKTEIAERALGGAVAFGAGEDADRRCAVQSAPLDVPVTARQQRVARVSLDTAAKRSSSLAGGRDAGVGRRVR